MAFFSSSSVTQSAPVPLVPRCGACGLHTSCKSPKMEVDGDGKRGVLIVGEAPGKHEDARGLPFVGDSGKLLSETLYECGVDLRRDCWITNAIVCRPPGNETPTDKEISYCRPNVVGAIRDLKPRVVILLGGVAVKSVLGWLWKDNPGGVTQWAGFQVPSQRIDAWICPTFHPSFVLREERGTAGLWFRRHLREAFSLDSRPWDGSPPDYASRVEIVESPTRAAKIVREMIRRGGPVAFDYETDRLKPDRPEARIVCCSVCWRGKRTIAYPWHGEAVEATRELLRSPLPKRASNLKFEERWSRAKLKTRVRNWEWDTMQAAHVIDNRSGITSIKFQSFVLLGQPTYNETVEPYLSGPGPNEPNRIREVDLRDLLLYCGMDSLLEFLVAERQMSLLEAK